MTKKEFAEIRKRIKKTQKEFAMLLGISKKTVESYEQGYRNIPSNIERIVYFLIFKLNMARFNEWELCWERKSCPSDIRENCIAWVAREGFFCWFITGKTCRKEQMTSSHNVESCFKCDFFLENLGKI